MISIIMMDGKLYDAARFMNVGKRFDAHFEIMNLAYSENCVQVMVLCKKMFSEKRKDRVKFTEIITFSMFFFCFWKAKNAVRQQIISRCIYWLNNLDGVHTNHHHLSKLLNDLS